MFRAPRFEDLNAALQDETIYLALVTGIVVLVVAVALAFVFRRRRSDDAAAAAIRESEARLAFLAGHMSDLVVRFDRSGVRTFISASCWRYGYQPEELVGRPGLELCHPEDQPRVAALIKGLLDGDESVAGTNIEMRARTKWGDWFWLEGAPNLIRDARGEVVEIAWVLRDVAARRALEAELVRQKAEAEASALLAKESHRIALMAEAVAGIGSWRVDVRTRAAHWSDGVFSIFGLDPKQGVPPLETLLAMYDEADRERVVENLRRGEAEGHPYTQAARVTLADGSVRYIQVSGGAERNSEGAVVTLFGIMIDITEARLREDQLRRKQAEAEAAVQAKAEFLANMSHEIRTPLTAVIGFAGLLARMPDLSEKAQTYAARITTGGRALLFLVNDILDFSRLEAGQIELDPQPLELKAFLDDTLELVRHEAEAKGLDLDLRLEAGLPPVVLADGERLRQVLLNLVGNAIKFTAEGGIHVDVGRFVAGGDRLRFTVRDTGVGISTDYRDRLFQRFSQVDGSNTRRFGGAGLGLAISKGLVQLMGGEIGVDSVEGRGSSFWFTLCAPAAGLQARDHDEVQDAVEIAALRVLVVDDVAGNRDLVTALLSPFDLQLTQAADGAEAVQAARRHAFDLILMDLQMPVMDGIAATRAIRTGAKLNVATPILAVSANVMPAQVEACLAAGMNDHVAKPIDPQSLLRKIAYWTTSEVARAVNA